MLGDDVCGIKIMPWNYEAFAGSARALCFLLAFVFTLEFYKAVRADSFGSFPFGQGEPTHRVSPWAHHLVSLAVGVSSFYILRFNQDFSGFCFF